ncbi:hypothetical protein HJG60_010703 [Phyllostomus discolor]|uniref:Peptidylprolyl isomerase n=1 Tax=Phyllostomus discolor TaxID=89673 RepID=A0A834ASK5_9CHIR|nr:hypothetical protein HJG60_010703 [Phyllostomus discolor]
MNSYPDLKDIHTGFRNAIRKEIRYRANDEGKSAKNHNIQLSLEQGAVDLRETSTTQEAKKKRWSKKCEGEFVDFHSEILPVTCGEMKGMLHKNKLKEGSKVKCIETEDGNWFTPSEFSVAGGYQKSSHWKSTVRCGGKTIKQLTEEGKLPTWSKKQGTETEALPMLLPPQTSQCPAKVNPTMVFDITSDGKNLGRVSLELFAKKGGDFTCHNGTDGKSICGAKYNDENFILKHPGLGILSMSNAEPNRNSSQCFICTATTEWLDGKDVVFGQVKDGLDVVTAMERYGSRNGKTNKKVSSTDCGQF